jgi:hypothetical protein
MSVKPILFNTGMVQAILDGRKTVTRRVITPQPEMALAYIMAGHNWGKWKYSVFEEEEYKKHQNENLYWTPPYNSGDILYVRETWQCINPYSDKEYVYKASCDADFASDIGKWLPSIHMPKEAARIWLRVINVRVERLQDITHKQAENEGVGDLFLDDIAYGEKRYNIPFIQEEGLSREQFAYLWDSTVKKEDINRYGWEGNPWVWVIEFERCEKPQEVEQ